MACRLFCSSTTSGRTWSFSMSTCPPLSGLSMREELTARDPTLDVIFVTGYADVFGDQLRRDCVLRSLSRPTRGWRRCAPTW